MDLTKEFRIRGKWSLPFDREHSCVGEFSYTFGKGLQLSLHGSLFNISSIHSAKSNIILDSIWGVTEDGKRLTLIKCFGHETGSSNFIKSTFNIEFASLSKSHFLTPESDL